MAPNTFGFSEALEGLKQGARVARMGWNGRGMFLSLQVPDVHSKMQLPYIYISTVEGRLVPWVASQTDLMADDWVGVETPIPASDSTGFGLAPTETTAG